MTMSYVTDDDVQVSLLAITGFAGLAATVLVQRFGLTLQYADSVLEQGYGLLTPRIGKAQAQQALPLLSSLGLRLAVQPVEAMPPDEVCDLSVRLRDPRNAPNVINAAEITLGLTGLTAADFTGPQGYIVPELSLARAEWLCAAFRKLNGVSCAISERRIALYDLFADRDLRGNDKAELNRHLRLMGYGSVGFGDAIGLGLERRVLDRVLSQFPKLGLFGVDRAFQRYELLVIGKGALSGREFTDFMMSRPATKTVDTRKLLQSLPLRLESWLTRKAAQQFLADYGSIGIQAETRLLRTVEQGA